MEATTAALLGSGIGASAGIAVNFMTHFLQSRRDHKQWLRNKKSEVYHNAIRYIIRVLGKRSSISIQDGKPVASISKEHIDIRFELGRLNWRPTLDRILDLVATHRYLCGCYLVTSRKRPLRATLSRSIDHLVTMREVEDLRSI